MNCENREYLKQLNPEQYKAVMHKGSPLLILAGAGSGKTRVITTKIAYLIDCCGEDPRSILAVTFTNKAALEMKERVSRLVPEADAVMIRTFHSFGAWMLRRHSHLIGLPPRFSIYDDEDSLNLLHSLFPEYKKNELKPFSRKISLAKDYCLLPDDDLTSVSFDSSFRKFYAAYEKRMAEVGSVDFGDLILKTLNLLKENKDVRKKIQNRFSLILVDEYQDSNRAQYELLKQLYGDGTYLCVVGDDDQSIYSFRGAEVQNIITFPESFSGASLIKLEQNYRSTETILKIASEVVERNVHRLGKTLWTKNDRGVKARITTVADQLEEARFCAQLLEDGNLDGTAILYRTNAQSLSFESYFLSRQIPYKIVGSLKFYDREEVKDALALFSLLLNPSDEIAFMRIINKPARGIGKKSVFRIREISYQKETDFVTAAELSIPDLSRKGGEAVRRFTDFLREAREYLAETDPGQFSKKVLTQSGLLAYYQKQDEAAATQRVKNLEELVNAASRYPAGETGLVQFLEDMELDRSRLAGNDPSSSEEVTLITMHNTKGLEFERVIITGMEEGLFPSRPDESEDDLEEERRIFYVSITRAKKELYFTLCRQRRIWGRVSMQSPSRFLSELPDDYIEREGEGTSHSPYPPGSWVYHPEYGTGQVWKEWNNGQNTVVLVRFETGKTAQFLPEYSDLEKISADNEW